MTTATEPSTTSHPVRSSRPFSDLDRILERSFPENWMRAWRPSWSSLDSLSEAFSERPPKVDIMDKGDNLILRAEIPGVDKKDLDISVSEDSVTIKGATSRDTKKEEGDYYCREISSASFARSMSLPCTVDPNKAKASLSDGVLELSLPKIAKTTSRNVTVD